MSCFIAQWRHEIAINLQRMALWMVSLFHKWLLYHFQFMLWSFSIPLHPMKYPSIWNTFYNFCSLSACYPPKWHVYRLALQSAFFLFESCRECHFTWVMLSSCTQFALAIRFSCLKLYCTAHWKLNSMTANVLLIFCVYIKHYVFTQQNKPKE